MVTLPVNYHASLSIYEPNETFFCRFCRTTVSAFTFCALFNAHSTFATPQLNAKATDSITRQVEQSIPAKTQKKLQRPKLSSKLQKSLFSSAKTGLIKSQPFVRLDKSSSVQVVLELSNTNDDSLAEITATGFKVELINHKLRKVQGWGSARQLDELMAFEFVTRVTAPNYAHMRSGTAFTEGDVILRSNLVRLSGLTGQGVRVGIISDGSNNVADAQNSGNLPSNVTRFGSCSTRAEDINNCSRALTCNEGTAMAEIIHDIAPNAELAIAAVSTDLEFLARLDQLANQFRADIIVDDLGFFGEPFFSDGPLAQAVSALPNNILYISSAGNSANSHYEEDFRLGSNPVLRPHEFAADGDNNIGFIIAPRSFVVPILQWSDDFDSPSSDYDMIVTNQTEVVGRSEADQSLPGTPPFEALCLPNTSSSNVVNFALVNQFSGSDKRIEMYFLGSPAIEFSIPAGSIFGHTGVPRAVAVASINASEPGNDAIAFYSSQGPARIDIPARSERAKPDLTGIDGVSVSGAGGFSSPFFGTSAAAPHVAGVAALLKSTSPKVTPKNIRDALRRGAVDLGAKGSDFVFGAGRVDALKASELLRLGNPLPPLLLLLGDEEPETD